MSRDASGTFNLAPGNPVISGTIIETAWANPTMSDIAAGLTDSLSRSGKGGMAAPLAMNGYKVISIGFATQATDVPQAIQVRDQQLTGFTFISSDVSGNNYVGTTLLTAPPTNGTSLQLFADRVNTGPMTLAVNGGAALPILINGAAVPPGLVVAGAAFNLTYVNLTYRVMGIVGGAGSTVNSVQSSDPALISVVNSAGIATLTPHANVAGGMVKLDGSTKVPVAQLPFTDLFYVGIWSAAAGTNPSTTGINNGDFYVITVNGTLTLFRDSGSNVYTAQPTAVVVGDAIILRKGSTNPNQPDGWYFDPGIARPAVGSTVAITPTNPLFPAITNLQSWLDNADPAIANRLLLSGGTMSGPIVQPLAPSTGTQLANRQYVDDKTAALVGVLSFNSRTGGVLLTSSDVTDALGYTPFSSTGGTITGSNVVITENLAVLGGAGAVYFQPAYFLNDTAPTSLVIDLFNGQSQRIGLTGNTVITAITNLPQGSMLRLTLVNTNFTVTWPANVNWPLGIAPSLAAGPNKVAIVVLESVSGAGGQILGSATVY